MEGVCAMSVCAVVHNVVLHKRKDVDEFVCYTEGEDVVWVITITQEVPQVDHIGSDTFAACCDLVDIIEY